MTRFNPSVEIIIPVFNGSKFLREAIYSALSQSYKNCTVTLVNDGSCDGNATEEIINSFGGRVKYLKKENGGVGSALNLALGQSNADYISWLSHDDTYGPKKIENQINKLVRNQNPFNTVIYSSYYLIDKNSNVFGENSLHDLVEEKRLSWGIYPLIRSFISGCTLLIPRKIICEENGFREDLKYTQDYELWSRLFDKAKFVYSESNDTFVRIHEGQDSQSGNKQRFQEENDMLWCSLITEVNSSHLENNVSELEIKCIFYNHLKNSPYLESPKFASASLLNYVSNNIKSRRFLNFYINRIANIYLIGLRKNNIEDIVNEISTFMEVKQLGKIHRVRIRKRIIIYEMRTQN